MSERLTKQGAVTQKDIDKLLELSDENRFRRNEAYFKLQYYEDLEESKKAIEYFKMRLNEKSHPPTTAQQKAFTAALEALERVEREDTLYDEFIEFLKKTRGTDDVCHD